MADGFLEKHHADYEARKAAWLNKQPGRRGAQQQQRQIERPEDEAL